MDDGDWDCFFCKAEDTARQINFGGLGCLEVCPRCEEFIQRHIRNFRPHTPSEYATAFYAITSYMLIERLDSGKQGM